MQLSRSSLDRGAGLVESSRRTRDGGVLQMSQGPDNESAWGTYPPPFRPVIDARAHEHVVDEIVFGIRSGAYRVGEKLPSVAGLAEQFGVSKPTIGEAIRLLADN